ncbi:hypothetical protein ADUPG1_005259, partial [Aduncisulcus paluster]
MLWKGKVACSVDLTDAFGSVHHTLLKSVIKDYTHGHVSSFLTNIINPIITVDGRQRTIYKGCPQGSPLSPIFFNLCLDRAIGTQLPTSCLGYADDLIVFGDNADDCNEKLAILADNLEAYAFVINPRKCFAIASAQLKIGDTLIHQGTASESMYLGIGIEPGAPLSAASLEQYKRAAQEARRIMSLPLLLP